MFEVLHLEVRKDLHCILSAKQNVNTLVFLDVDVFFTINLESIDDL